MSDRRATVSDEPLRWPVVSSVTSFAGRVVSVRSDEVRSPVDGSTFVRDVVVHPGAVAVVALDDEERVLLVGQYRHPVGHRLLEIPAGLRDVDGEPPHRTAERELYEEGHVRASEWRSLADIYASPGMTDEAIRIYLARGVSDVPADERFRGPDEEADMPVSWLALPEAVEAVLAGRIHNGTTCVGILATWAARNGAGYDALRPADVPWR